MFNVTGKLASGQSFRATVPSTDASEAVKVVMRNMPAGEAMASLTLKPADPSGFIKFAKPRATNGTAPRTKRARGKRSAK